MLVLINDIGRKKNEPDGSLLRIAKKRPFTIRFISLQIIVKVKLLKAH